MVDIISTMDLKVLNNEQLAAVTAPLGPVLVLAGAGSGKTRVLTYRIAYLIEQGLVKPEDILALTFTNKAAKEMLDRVTKLLATTKHSDRAGVFTPTMGTFHSVSAKLLRKEIHNLGYRPNFTILDSEDQLKVIKDVCDEMGLSKEKKDPSPNTFRFFISNAKNALMTPAELALDIDEPLFTQVREVYARYQNFLYNQNSVDFDDLIMLTVKLFEAFPKILAKYQDRFKYILVDEYQDTNPAQFALLSLLAGSENLFVVGDDAQSIYGFRGSDIRNILEFEAAYPKALVFKLEQNYRSTKHILAVSDSVIRLNPEQKPKTLWTENPAGKPVRLEEVEDERAEAEFVAKKVVQLATGKEEEAVEYVAEEENKPFSILDHFLKKQHASSILNISQLPKNHASLNQFAVLYRTHAQSRALEEVFMRAGIPYRIVGGLRFYERKEIKDLLAYLRLVVNARDVVAMRRVINEPARGVGDKSFSGLRELLLSKLPDGVGEGEDLVKANREVLEYIKNSLPNISAPKKGMEGISQFLWLIESFVEFDETKTLLELSRFVVKKAEFEKNLKDGTEVGEVRYENIKELLNVTAKYNNLAWPEAISVFLEEVALVSDADNVEEETDAVTLLTLHSAKGLEFDTVFFVGLEEGILPHSRALLDPKELSEEIRLAYVGLTRARKHLFLVYARMRSQFGNVSFQSPSRILRVLPEKNISTNSTSHKLVDTDSEVSYEQIDF